MSTVQLDALVGRTPPPALAPTPSATSGAEEFTAFLDGEHAALKAEIRAVLSQPDFAYRYDVDRTQYREFILQRCRNLARYGWGAALYPDGDRRGDVPRFLAAFETLGISDPNLLIKFGLQFGLFGGAILYLGTERHHEQYLPQIAAMTLVGCYAMTEVGHGSDIRRLETVARYDRATREFVIDTPRPDARKQFIGNAAMHADAAVVFAQIEVGGARPGVFGFLVPIRNADGSLRPGVSIGDTGPKAGLHGIDNGWLSFERVRIPRENLLDRFGTVTPDGQYESTVDDPTDLVMRSMSGGRLAMALAALSATKAGLTIAIRHGERRRQFGGADGRRLLDYPLHRRRLLLPLATAYALDAALKQAAALSADTAGMTDPQFEELAAICKAYSTWNAIGTLQECREACGGQGYLAVNRIGLLRADIDPMTTLEGDNSLLYILTARKQLKRFGDMHARGGWLASLSKMLVHRCEKIVVTSVLRLDVETRLQDPDVLLRLLRLREQALLWDTARRLHAARKAGGDGSDYQTPLVELSQAVVERLTFEAFATQVERSPRTIRHVLTLLRDLYAMSLLSRHSSWYLREKVTSPSQTRRVEGLITELCNQIRPHALSLVGGFAISDACLGAPIARIDNEK
jgi:acyl-CoA oxidase